jgi:hypothetical protein
VSEIAIAEREYALLRRDLGERVKELTMLHQAAQVLAEDARPVEEVLRDLVQLMPPAWQYPEVTAARIVVGNLEVTTSGFAEAPWTQQAGFISSHGERGLLQVVYLEPRPVEAEGPFLAEERSLIESLAQMVRTALDRRAAWGAAARD